MSPGASRTRRRGTQVLARLLDRNHIEAGDDVGNATQVEEVPPGRVVLARAPLLGHPAEGAKAPGGNEEIAVEMPGRDRSVQRGDESPEDFGEVLR